MFGEALDEAGFDDLDDSLNVFIALNACGLLLLTIGLAALRSQTGLAQWVGGLRVCDVKTGKPCGFGRVLKSDAIHGLLDGEPMRQIGLCNT